MSASPSTRRSGCSTMSRRRSLQPTQMVASQAHRRSTTRHEGGPSRDQQPEHQDDTWCQDDTQRPQATRQQRQRPQATRHMCAVWRACEPRRDSTWHREADDWRGRPSQTYNVYTVRKRYIWPDHDRHSDARDRWQPARVIRQRHRFRRQYCRGIAPTLFSLPTVEAYRTRAPVTPRKYMNTTQEGCP